MANPYIPDFRDGSGAYSDSLLQDMRFQDQAQKQASLEGTQASTAQTQQQTDRSKQMMPWDLQQKQQDYQKGKLGMDQTQQGMEIAKSQEDRAQSKWDQELSKKAGTPEFYTEIGNIADMDMPEAYKLATIKGIMERNGSVGQAMMEQIDKGLADGTLTIDQLGKEFRNGAKRMIEQSAASEKQRLVSEGRLAQEQEKNVGKIKAAEIAAEARVQSAKAAADARIQTQRSNAPNGEKAMSAEQSATMYKRKAIEARNAGNMELAQQYQDDADSFLRDAAYYKSLSGNPTQTTINQEGTGLQQNQRRTAPGDPVANMPRQTDAGAGTSTTNSTGKTSGGVPRYERDPTTGKMKRVN